LPNKIAGENEMRNLILCGLFLFILVLDCQSVEPIHIDRDNGMTILENLTISSSDQTDTKATSAINQTNLTSKSSTSTAGGLWSWGDTPIGYELNKSGSLISLANQEWVPSI
jgi:hypothetical protein